MSGFHPPEPPHPVSRRALPRLLLALTVLAATLTSGVVATATIRSAKEELDREDIDVAILDINLGDHSSLPIAEDLASRGIPFLFATGYGDDSYLPAKLENVPIVQKPYQADAIAEALGKLSSAFQ